MRLLPSVCAATALLAAAGITSAAAADNPFVGNWALTIPGGGAGWLGITHEKGYYDGGILWGGGSVEPVASVFFGDDVMYVVRLHEVKRKDATGKVVRTQQFPEAIMVRLDGDELKLVQVLPRDSGEGIIREQFTGKRIPG